MRVFACAFFALFFSWSSAFAQIPAKSLRAKDGVEFIHHLQILNHALNADRVDVRMNGWGGVKATSGPGITVGNWPSSTSIPASNEMWTFEARDDGRIFIYASNSSYLCLSMDTAPHNKFEKDFGGAKIQGASLKACANQISQQFFLQKTAPLPSGSLKGAASFVIRSVHSPELCLSNFINSTQDAKRSPLTFESCNLAGSKSDRWVIIPSAKNDEALKRLDHLATIWALHDYRDKGGEQIYNSEVKPVIHQTTLVIDAETKYKRMPFSSPFTGKSIDAYVNATPQLQELHIERFETHNIDVGIEFGESTVSERWGFKFDAKQKLDFKNATQENVKLWQKVPPYSTMFFLAGKINVRGQYMVEVTTDLGDKWVSDGGKFNQDVITSLIACTDTSTSSVCSKAAKD